ncbi:MAG: glycosyl transferase [Roseobacter sp.]|nr:glycosyl transferase [Roseobacter sp.]|tara:strand:+ start:1789 stop:2886 length:1098 start_codon:yes stop_codon:yes gene_type:complete
MTEYIRHISIYIPSLRGGGAERVMVVLANGLADRGHKVDLLLTQAVGPYLADVSKDVRIIDLNRNRAMTSLIPLATYFRRERPDAMLTAMNYANIIAIVAKILARSRSRLVVSEHCPPSLWMFGSVRGKIMRYLIKLFYPFADRVVCISNGMASEMNELLNVPRSKLTAIYNPIDIDSLQKQMKSPADHPWLLEHSHPVVLAVGRLSWEKDYPTLLKAFSKLRATRSARLIILGQGEEEKRLNDCAEELGIAGDVSFAGFQENPFSFMASCDLYVMSSAYEGFGNALVEAMACGARVVSTNCPNGPNEILGSGLWGRLAPVGDDDALANAMAATMDDQSPPDVWKRAEEFRSEVAVAAYERVLVQ